MSIMHAKATRPARKKMPPGPRPLPDNARRVLEFITDHETAYGKFPSRTQVIDHMQWSHASTYNDVMFTLAVAGKVQIVSREPSGRGFRYHYALADTQPSKIDT